MRTIGNMYTPYKKNDEDTMDDYYKEYLQDNERYIDIGGERYSKIIYRAEFYHKEGYWFLVTYETLEPIREGDVLIDESGNEFVFKATESIRFRGDIPDWHFKISTVLVQAKSYDIGCYLRKKKD